MNNISFSPQLFAGEFALIGLILIFILVEILQKRPLFALANPSDLTARNKQAGIIAAVGMGVVIVILSLFGSGGVDHTQVILNNSLIAGGGIFIGKLVLVSAAFLVILLSFRYTITQSIPAADYYLLLTFSLLGSITLISAEHFLVIFLALEMMSIPIYALVGLNRYKTRAGESAMKYLLLGGFSSAFLLLGISFLCGVTGSFGITVVLEQLTKLNQTSNTTTLLTGVGLILIFTGLAFKVSLFPFHAWTPDVYEGASTPITAYMSVVIKLSAFAVMLRLFASATTLVAFDGLLSKIITFFALITVIYGNSVALVQKNVKRMLAYSSIAHAGYMALGLAPMLRSESAIQAVLFYGIGYVAMNTLAFGVLIYLTHQKAYCENLDDLRGLSRTHPAAAAVMALAMFSLAGIPPAIGFAGKLQIFLQLVNAEMYVTTVIALLASLVSLYFYLNVIVQMYMRSLDTEPATPFETTGKISTSVVLGLTAAFTLIMGILPGYVMDWSLEWAKSLH